MKFRFLLFLVLLVSTFGFAQSSKINTIPYGGTGANTAISAFNNLAPTCTEPNCIITKNTDGNWDSSLVPTYYAEMFGVIADDTTDNCSSLMDSISGAFSIVSTLGGGVIQLPYGGLTAVINCPNVAIPGNVVLKASGTNGWNGGATPDPPGGLDLKNTSGTGPIITCLEEGTCGLQDMFIKTNTTRPMGPLFTCSVPVLINVEWKGKTSANGTTCANGGACPVNDGPYFGQGFASSACSTPNASFSGYGANRLYDLYFQNMSTWVTLNTNANGLHFHGLRGDYTDANPLGQAILIGESNGLTNPIYGFSFEDISPEQAPFGSNTLCNYGDIFKLTTYAQGGRIFYGSSDVGGCVHSMDITSTTSKNNFILVTNGATSGTPVNDVGLSSGNNTILDMVNRAFYLQSAYINNVYIGGGTRQVYECATAGTVLPQGTLTMQAAQCGTTNNTGLRLP